MWSGQADWWPNDVASLGHFYIWTMHGVCSAGLPGRDSGAGSSAANTNENEDQDKDSDDGSTCKNLGHRRP
jgi:hypothetical protein